jgi:hypothetical protein
MDWPQSLSDRRRDRASNWMDNQQRASLLTCVTGHRSEGEKDILGFRRVHVISDAGRALPACLN